VTLRENKYLRPNCPLHCPAPSRKRQVLLAPMVPLRTRTLIASMWMQTLDAPSLPLDRLARLQILPLMNPSLTLLLITSNANDRTLNGYELLNRIAAAEVESVGYGNHECYICLRVPGICAESLKHRDGELTASI